VSASRSSTTICGKSLTDRADARTDVDDEVKLIMLVMKTRRRMRGGGGMMIA
jgi:hypothetical protein